MSHFVITDLSYAATVVAIATTVVGFESVCHDQPVAIMKHFDSDLQDLNLPFSFRSHCFLGFHLAYYFGFRH